MWEAYSHEVSSAGYWPGPERRRRLLLLRLRRASRVSGRVRLTGPGVIRRGLGEFTLPYTAVREADDPDAVLLEFLQSTYDVAADTGNWDRARWNAAGDGRTDGVAQEGDRRSESRGNEVDH
jgi:Family of unknown function (DUF5996)